MIFMLFILCGTFRVCYLYIYKKKKKMIHSLDQILEGRASPGEGLASSVVNCFGALQVKKLRFLVYILLAKEEV
jgi:hypothetical protein